MDKENGERSASCDRSEKSAPPTADTPNLLDAASLFGAYWPRTDATGSAGANAAGHPLFGGMPGGYGHPLSSAYSAMLGSARAGSAGGFPSHGPPTTSSYGSLGTLSVAASQAASLGINPASAAWWTMASQLAAQDYLARLQASAAATGMPGFATIPTPEGLLPGYPLLPHAQTHGFDFLKTLNGVVSASGKQSSSSSSSSSSSHTKASSMSAYPPQSPVPTSNTGGATGSSSSSHHHSSSAHRGSPVTTPASQPVPPPPSLLSDSASILGGVRLPPDTEIIKYTSSIIGPKVPGTTNRGRKKTISLDPPSVSVMPTHSSTGLLIERTRKSRHAHHQPQPPADYRESADRVEVIKLPASVPSAVSNGRATPQTPLLNTGYVSSDAPLNLSLKPSSSASPTNNALQSLSSLSQSLGSQSDRTSRRKPGPKPRRVTPSPLPPPGPSPSPSLAQLFAAADSPRPSSGSEENESGTHHKDGRPRNLGRGVSKPKKNTVASLLAQSRALGLKPGLDLNSPLNHQVSLLKANILQQQMQVEQAEREKEIQERIQDRLQASSPAVITTTTTTVTTTVTPTTTTTVTTTISATTEDIDRNRKTQVTSLQQANYRSLEELKALIGENLSDQSSLPDISTDSNSDSDFDSDGDITGDRKREGDHSTEDSGGKRRKVARDIADLRIPLELGWRRETLIRGLTHTGHIQGDVTYISPCGRRLKQYPDVLRYLEKSNITGLTRDNFSFSSRAIVGDFLQPGLGTEEPTRLSEQEINRRMEELKSLNSHRQEVSQYLTQKVDREKLMLAAKEAKKAAREEALKQKEQARLQKEQEKTERQEALRKEKEQRSVQLMEGRKRLAFTSEQKWQIIREIEAGKSKSDVSRALGLATSTVATIWKNRSCVTPSPGANNAARRKFREVLEKQRQIEIQRRQQERELKRQQAALLKEQLYMQELNKQRELLYTVELERERRRQHMTLVKALEARKKIEERERKRQEARAEKLASRERRLEQRRIEVELLQEIRKPVEDMELTDLKPLPTLNRIHGLKLSGQAFADTLMVFEFLHNFGETLGFDMESLPTLNSLQNALLGDEEAEEELLSVMTHLIICAIEDPGIPNPARHTTLLGQSLKQADITHTNLSEILRIYLYANATGEVKALAGVHFERDREKRISDHHNNMSDSASEEIWEGGKNAAFFVALRENQTWKMSEWLRKKPFLALNATHKAAILAFLCHELLQNKAVIRQIDGAIETVAQLRRDRWMTDTKIRKLKHLHNRKVRQIAVGMSGGKPIEGIEEEVVPKEADEEEDAEVESGNESEGTQPEEEEDKKLSVEELGRKLEKLNRQAEQNLTALNESNGQLRATCYGQDRFWRRYWCLPTAGGVYVEAMESAEPDLFRQLSEEEDAERPYLKEDDVADDDARSLDTDAEMPHLTPEVGLESLLHQDEIKKTLDAMELDEKEDKDAQGETGRFDEMECDERQIKAELFGTEDDYDEKTVLDEKLQTFQHLQFERLDENTDKATAESGSLNGGQGSGNISDSITSGGNASESEPSWFNILPREACDTTSVTQTASTFRCGTENSELRIPVFPPPPPASPSLSQCDSPSPAPLALTPEESAQLEYCKVHGLPRAATPKPVPQEMRYGWWRITEAEQLQAVVNSLHPRGARERELKRTITRPCLEQSWDSTLKMCVRPGSTTATQFTVNEVDNRIAASPLGVPQPDSPDDWNHDVALRVDMAVLEQVEAMEDKVANASMQVKGWKVPFRASTEEGARFRPACSHPDEAHNPVALAKNRLIALEAAIERRYLKPPLGMSTGDVNLSGTNIEAAESIPKGLVVWREAVAKAQTSAQLSMALYMLEASIAWDKSIMKANCQFCHSGDNEDKLLLCDGCDKGYHTYCFKPKMENIPDGDWYCYECMNKATGERNCIVCGKKCGRNLILCDHCPRAYHTDCLQPALPKVPRGKWHCPTCQSKLPKKRSNTKRSSSGSNINSTSPSGSANRSCDEISSSNMEPMVSPARDDASPESPPPPTTTTPSKKEKAGGKKMAKEMAPCRQLLDDLESHDEAWPFLLPVNTKQFPTYKKIIKNPMDLSTIRKRLMDSGYKSREEFCADVRLIFNNCETFNEDDSPVGKAGHGMRLFFETRWAELTNQKPPS